MRLSFQTVSMLMLSPRNKMKSRLFSTLVSAWHLFCHSADNDIFERTQEKVVKEMALKTFNVMLPIAFQMVDHM